jgi:hypothetical protein
MVHEATQLMCHPRALSTSLSRVIRNVSMGIGELRTPTPRDTPTTIPR